MTAQNTAGTDGPHIERATVEQGAGARQGESGVKQIAAERAKQLAEAGWERRWTRTDRPAAQSDDEPIEHLRGERGAEQPVAAPSARPFWPVGTSDEEAGPRSPHPQISDETWADLCRIRGRQAAAPPVLPGEEYWLVEGREGGFTAWAKLLPKCGGLCQWTAPADATKFRSRELAHQAAAVLARDVTRLEITVTSHVDVPPVAVEPKAPSEPLPGLGQAPAEADKESVEDDRLWAAINDYVRACGGDSGAEAVGWGRMDAVVAIEAALKERVEAAVSGAPKSERLQLYRVQFDDMDSYVVATSMAAAIERWKAADPDEGDHEPDGCELVCFGGDLILPEVRS